MAQSMETRRETYENRSAWMRAALVSGFLAIASQKSPWQSLTARRERKSIVEEP
jgi:hypothetical protein